jgi:hypothetical protein
MNKVDESTKKMILTLKSKTGKELDYWIRVVKKSKFEKHSTIVKFLKEEHQFTHGFANLVALKTNGTDSGSVHDKNDLIKKQFKGKEDLHLLYQTIIQKLKVLEEVEIAPKNAYVSLRRNKQFAIIQPSTKTRIDIGLILRGIESKGRLEPSGNFNAMCTHRIRIQSPHDIDSELFQWFKLAYENA